VNITIQQIKTLDAVIKQGSMQAGAELLHKTHPSVITMLKKLERELGFSLFDRSGYRLKLTQDGKAFYKRTKSFLNNLEELEVAAQYIRNDEEPEITVVIGDVTPVAEVLKVLRRFSVENKYTQLNLLFENLDGANERLLSGDADLMIHNIDKSDPQLEYKDIGQVDIIPVVGKNFLDMPINNQMKFSDLSQYMQCIIRSTASKKAETSYFVLEESPHMTVGDQHTKKQVIMQCMAWGHMPFFMIEEELEKGKLLSLEGEYLKRKTLDIGVSRMQKRSYGVMTNRLWNLF